MARATPLQKPYGPSQTMRSGSRPPLQIHFEAGDPAAVVEWRGRPRFKDPMALFRNAQWKPTAAPTRCPKDEQMDLYDSEHRTPTPDHPYMCLGTYMP